MMFDATSSLYYPSKGHKRPPMQVSYRRNKPPREPEYQVLNNSIGEEALNHGIFGCLEFLANFEPKAIMDLCLELKDCFTEEDLSQELFHIGTAFSLPVSYAEIICHYLCRTKDPDGLRKMLNKFPAQSLLEESVKEFHKYTPDQLNELILEEVTRNGQSIYYHVFIFLAAYLDGIECAMMRLFLSKIPLDSPEYEKSVIADKFRMENGFDKSPCVKRWTQALRKQLNEYTEKTYHVDNAAQCLLTQMCNQPAKFSAYLDDMPRPDIRFRALYRYMGFLHFDVFIRDDMPEAITVAEQVIMDTIYDHLITCYEEYYAEHRSSRSKEKIPKDILSWDREDNSNELSEWLVNSVVRKTDIDMLYCSCYLDLAVFLMQEQVRRYVKCASLSVLNEQIIEKQAAVLPSSWPEEMERLTKENQALRKKNRKLKQGKVGRSDQQIEKLSRELETVCKKSAAKAQIIKKEKAELNSAVKTAEEECAKLRKELRKSATEVQNLKNKLDLQTAITEGLQEKINVLSHPDELEEINADPNGKYLFIIENDRMKMKLRQWFPNSTISDGVDITRFNAYTYEMAVCITKSTSHKEWYRIKNKCISYGIPYVYCNVANYEAVLRTISEAKEQIELTGNKTED